MNVIQRFRKEQCRAIIRHYWYDFKELACGVFMAAFALAAGGIFALGLYSLRFLL